ncbi:MAG: hypothetical protein AAGD38_13450, partial [Acidobacteriota bacterium]
QTVAALASRSSQNLGRIEKERLQLDTRTFERATVDVWPHLRFGGKTTQHAHFHVSRKGRKHDDAMRNAKVNRPLEIVLRRRLGKVHSGVASLARTGKASTSLGTRADRQRLDLLLGKLGGEASRASLLARRAVIHDDMQQRISFVTDILIRCQHTLEHEHARARASFMIVIPSVERRHDEDTDEQTAQGQPKRKALLLGSVAAAPPFTDQGSCILG